MNVSSAFFKIMFFSGLMLSHSAFASCDRSDIAYYLESGFTPDQITKICTKENTVNSGNQQPDNNSATRTDNNRNTSTDNNRNTSTDNNRNTSTDNNRNTSTDNNRNTSNDNNRNTQQESRPESKTAFLESAIDADNIEFYDDKFTFERRKCITYSDAAESIDKPDVHCADIRTIVNFSNLKILKSKRSALNLFAKSSFRVKGDIEIEIVDTAKFKASLRRFERNLVLKKLNIQPVSVPLREGVDRGEARAKLKELL